MISYLLIFIDASHTYESGVIIRCTCVLGALSPNCYGPYILDSISTQRGLGKIGSQYTRYRTDGTSKAIGQGVAESHN